MNPAVIEMRRFAYRAAVGGQALAALPFRNRTGAIAPFYGGAYAGDGGGPLIKLRMLSARFPEQRLGWSLLYILSNAIYVPRAVLAAVRLAGVPIVLNQNGVFYPAWYPHGWERENARMAAVHAAASHVFYQSEFCRRAAERFLGARSGPSEVLYNAVDTTHFKPIEKRAEARSFTVLLTGKIVATTAYRLSTAIDAVAAARRGGVEVRLVVAGLVQNDALRQARERAERLGVAADVDFRGPYRWSEAPRVYGSADAYLMTKHNDPCPNVVLEAMACGLPVVHLASGGVPELVGEEAGVGIPVAETFEHVPSPDPVTVANAMATVLGKCEAMGRAARQRAADRFDVAPWLRRHEAVFSQLLSEAQRGEAA